MCDFTRDRPWRHAIRKYILSGRGARLGEMSPFLARPAKQWASDMSFFLPGMFLTCLALATILPISKRIQTILKVLLSKTPVLSMVETSGLFNLIHEISVSTFEYKVAVSKISFFSLPS
jgi:hypothetical protein